MDEQGIDEINEFKVLTHDDISNIYKVVRRLGGTITHPSAVLLVPVGAVAPPANIPIPGNQISAVAYGIFKLDFYFVEHQERVSRDIAPDDATLAVSRGIRETK